jgi:hypothetical protein
MNYNGQVIEAVIFFLLLGNRWIRRISIYTFFVKVDSVYVKLLCRRHISWIALENNSVIYLQNMKPFSYQTAYQIPLSCA